MELCEQLDFDFNGNTEEQFRQLQLERKTETLGLTPEMFDFSVGNSSLRFDWILAIEDKQEKIFEMSKLISETLPFQFPDEFLEFYARQVLNIPYSKYEINEIKKTHKEKVKQEKMEARENKKKLKVEKKNVKLEF